MFGGVITLIVLEIWVMSNNLLESYLKSVSDAKSEDLKSLFSSKSPYLNSFFSLKTIQKSQFWASLDLLGRAQMWTCQNVVTKQMFTYLDLFEHQRPLGFWESIPQRFLSNLIGTRASLPRAETGAKGGLWALGWFYLVIA